MEVLGGVFVRETDGFTSPSPLPPKVQLHTSLRTSARTYRTQYCFRAADRSSGPDFARDEIWPGSPISGPEALLCNMITSQSPGRAFATATGLNLAPVFLFRKQTQVTRRGGGGCNLTPPGEEGQVKTPGGGGKGGLGYNRGWGGRGERL